MSININQNRYRTILLLYLVFICLSLLSVPKSFIESNLYMIRTLSFQESLLKGQLSALDDSTQRLTVLALQSAEGKQVVALTEKNRFLQDRFSATYRYADSIDQSLQGYLRSSQTNINAESGKKRKINYFFKRDSTIFKLQQLLFDLIRDTKRADTALGIELQRQLPAVDRIVSRTKKEYGWQQYFFIDKPASVAYMHLKRIKLLLLESGIRLNNQRLYSLRLAVNGATTSMEQQRQPSSFRNQLKIDSLSQFSISVPEQLQFEIFNSVRLERFYVGVPMTLLTVTDKLKLKDLEVVLTPAVRLLDNTDRLQVLFSSAGQYQLQIFFRSENGRKLLLQRKVNADRLPDPLVRVNLEGNNRNVISREDLSQINSLLASIPVMGLPPIVLRVNGFRGTIVGGTFETSSVYNYGQVFQDPMKQLINSLKQGDLLLLDNITVAVGDGSTRSASSILYKIVD